MQSPRGPPLLEQPTPTPLRPLSLELVLWTGNEFRPLLAPAEGSLRPGWPCRGCRRGCTRPEPSFESTAGDEKVRSMMLPGASSTCERPWWSASAEDGEGMIPSAAGICGSSCCSSSPLLFSSWELPLAGPRMPGGLRRGAALGLDGSRA